MNHNYSVNQNTGKTWSKEEIKTMLVQSDKAVLRAVVAIFKYQTDMEKASHHTNNTNGVGFNKCDAPLLSSFAEQIIRRGALSDKQMIYARKKICKYAGQLANIANGKI
jgi:hypothetical protein